MSKPFISHSAQDDGFVHGLQQALGDLRQDVWIDSRELATEAVVVTVYVYYF